MIRAISNPFPDEPDPPGIRRINWVEFDPLIEFAPDDLAAVERWLSNEPELNRPDYVAFVEAVIRQACRALAIPASVVLVHTGHLRRSI